MGSTRSHATVIKLCLERPYPMPLTNVPRGTGLRRSPALRWDVNISRKSRIAVRSRAFYASVSAIALVASGALSPAHAVYVPSRPPPAGLAAGVRTGGNQGTAIQAATLANPALQAQIALSAANLAKAAQAIKDVNLAQAAARASSKLTLNNAPLSGSSWNGAVLSGLKPVDDTDPTIWINAEGLKKNNQTATATVK